MAAFDSLLARLADIQNLRRAGAVLEWDQRTYMPPRGSEARSKSIGTLAKLSHELFVARETQDLLAAAEATRPAAGSDPHAILRITRRDMDKAVKVPTDLVVAMAETFSRGQDVWQEAREKNDYPLFAPWLDKIVDLKRQYAAAIAPGIPIYDALLDEFEEGVTSRQLNPLFQTLKDQTIPLLTAIQSRGKANSDDLLTRDYHAAGQQTFSTFILQECGFPFDRGRLDVSAHPFCTNFSQNDVRITTRYETNWLPGALFGCLHEMGHAFYELNVDTAYEATPLSGGVSLGVHESQSRLWENLVGRSREFWRRYYPRLQAQFPAQLGNVDGDTFYRAINHVTPSFIRVEADELTYNLHIILRYELEQALLNRELSVSDAPAAWNQRMHAYLGITPPTDREGILQDVHWSGGGLGYFPTYTLGNVLAAQLFEAASRELPGLKSGFAEGRFGPLLGWLKEKVHRHGSKYLPRDLVTMATGRPLTTEPYLRYLQDKFEAIYEL